MAPGPGCQPADCARAAGTDASSSAVTAATNATIRGRAKRIAALLRRMRSTTLKHTARHSATAPKAVCARATVALGDQWARMRHNRIVDWQTKRIGAAYDLRAPD